MAANKKFTAMLHKNNNRIVIVLIYAVLEWTLIFLLLLNGVFSYLIAKFAGFFGLEPPCIVCSRVDHLFETVEGRPPLRDLLCEGHAGEVSDLAYCSHHRRLAKAGDMCEACCSSTRPSDLGEKGLRCSCCDVILESEFYSYWLLDPSSQMGNFIEQMVSNEEGTSVEENMEEVKLLTLGVTDDKGHNIAFETEKDEEVIAGEEDAVGVLDSVPFVQFADSRSLVDDASIEVLTRHVENVHHEERLVPIELVDCTTMYENYRICTGDDNVLGDVTFELDSKALDTTSIAAETNDVMEENSCRHDQMKRGIGCLEEEERVWIYDTERVNAVEVGSSSVRHTEEEENQLALDTEKADIVEVDSLIRYDVVEQDAMILDAKNNFTEDTFASAKEKANCMEQEFSGIDGMEQATKILDVKRTSEEEKALYLSLVRDDSIDMNSPEHDGVEKGYVKVDAESIVEGEKALPATFEMVNLIVQNSLVLSALEPTSNPSYNHNSEAMPDTILHNNVVDQVGALIVEQDAPEQQGTISEIGEMTTGTRSHDGLLVHEPSDIEEERAPETPTSVYDIHGIHKRFLFGRTESLDGSVTSEVEGCDTLTLEQLRSTLQAERKALHALYADLEEERSAAAIATNQTMAMINRLQEEKAAMQMEALQYQRMMEEQSEYDQEALHLLNDILLKREREKQELEIELEVYRKKVFLYEARERRITKDKINGRGGTYSASSAENTDDLSFDFQEGDDYTLSLDETNSINPVDVELSSGINRNTANKIFTVTESLNNFEQERLSVLEELKALELKIFSLEDEDTHDLEDFDSYPAKNGLLSNGEDYEHLSNDRHDALDGFSDDMDFSGKLHCERSKGLRGKRLSPLFDAISNDNEDMYTEDEADDASTVATSRIAKEEKGYNQHPLEVTSS